MPRGESLRSHRTRFARSLGMPAAERRPSYEAHGAESYEQRSCESHERSESFSAVRGGLKAIELCVLAAFRHERIVRADFHGVRPVEDDDQIRHANGREAM